MDTASDRRRLGLSVSNFGPIAEGRIELRPMTVFVGPSNTGKSYLATLIYALHGFFRNYAGNSGFRRVFSGRPLPRMMPSIPLYSPLLSAGDGSSVLAWANKMLTGNSEGFLYLPKSELPDNIAGLVRPAIDKVDHLKPMMRDEVARCFGVNAAQALVSYPGEDESKFSLRSDAVSAAGPEKRFGYDFTITRQEVTFDASIPQTATLRTSSSVSFPWYFSDDPFSDDTDDGEASQIESAQTLLAIIARKVIADIVGPFSRPAYYLPADRAGVMHAHQLAVRGIIANASRIALRPDGSMPVLSGVLGDFLEQLVGLTGHPRPGSEQSVKGDGLARRLERELLIGEVRVERAQIDYPSFLYRPAGWERDLPLINTSSMVSELAPVALYLRYVARPGDTLIIEEPESHLHPDMQVRLVRELAAAVKAGIRIIITTHSEWVLEELANLALLSELPPERREGIEGADVALGLDEFGAWFFEPGQDGAGSKVREMPLDVEDGNFPSGFGLVTADLYNRWAKISNRIERDRYNAGHDSR